MTTMAGAPKVRSPADPVMRVQAQFLAEVETPGWAGAIPGLAQLPAAPPAPATQTRHGHWSERDLRRAIAVVRRAGLKAFRVEIAPDGTISIVVGTAKTASRRRT